MGSDISRKNVIKARETLRFRLGQQRVTLSNKKEHITRGKARYSIRLSALELTEANSAAVIFGWRRRSCAIMATAARHFDLATRSDQPTSAA